MYTLVCWTEFNYNEETIERHKCNSLDEAWGMLNRLRENDDYTQIEMLGGNGALLLKYDTRDEG